jgi:tetratricopeptide (TPR) repeat protein
MKLKLWIAGLFLFGALMPGLAAETLTSVAVLDFSVPSAAGDRWTWAESGMADLLQIELQQQGLLLLDRDAIHAVLNEQRLAVGGQSVRDYLTIAKLLNAQFLITGRVVPLAGGRFRVEAGAFSVEAVETEVTVTSEGDFPKELSRVLQDVAKQIALKLPTRSGFTSQTEQTTHAPKPEALIMFYRGLNACAQGQPDWGAAYFMNAASLDPDFSVPLLWEIKAYEMADLTQQAAIRHEEMADVLKRLGMETPGGTNALEQASQAVFAVLNPVVTAGDGSIDATSLDTALTRSLLATGRVRVFAFEGIGAAVTDQDLRLSSFFADQYAPRYGRWLASDGLVLCRVHPAGTNLVALELSLVNPLNASVMARIDRTGPATALPGQIPAIVGELLATWKNRPVTAISPLVTPGSSPDQSDNENTDLRPVYRELVAAMAQVRRDPEKSDSHRALANAFAATGRTRLAAHEIEQCLKLLDIHASHADTTYLGTHRWLFWEPSPASAAVGLVDQRLIEQLIEQLLTSYPHTLAAGCMRYNLAVTAWRTDKWPEAITQAEQARQTMQPIIAQYDRNDHSINGGELDCEMVAATYFLEGSSLDKLGKPEEAKSVFHQGLDFMKAFKVRNFCLPLGPFLGDFFDPQRVYGYGGDAPGIKTRIEQQLVALEGKPEHPAGLDLQRDAEDIVSATNAPSRTGKEWLDCARQIADIMDQSPVGDADSLKGILASANACLNAARGKGAQDVDLRPLIHRFVSMILAKQKIRSLDNASSVSVPTLSEATGEVMSVYESAGLKEEGWTVIEPLFNDDHPIELLLNLLQQLNWDKDRYSQALERAAARERSGTTNVSVTAWLKLGQIYNQNQHYGDALDCYQKAVAQGASATACPGLASALLEIALDRNLDHPQEEIEKLRREFGFPPVQASWVEWFAAGRKYQAGPQFGFQKAAACYRGALDFLEHPEQIGVYHLEKQPNSDRIALRWGPGLGMVDLLWSDHYDTRWYNAAFYLAQCLIKLDQKEEAAQWLRRIAIKVGGDSSIPLLERDDWFSSSWSSSGLGVRAAEVLKELHQDDGLR